MDFNLQENSHLIDQCVAVLKALPFSAHNGLLPKPAIFKHSLAHIHIPLPFLIYGGKKKNHIVKKSESDEPDHEKS